MATADRSNGFIRSTLFTAGAGALLAVSLALTLQAFRLATLAQHTGVASIVGGKTQLDPAFVRALPYPVLDQSLGPPRSYHVAIIALGLVQALLLYALYRSLRGRAVPPGERAVLSVVAVAMAAIALRAPAIASFDPYAYVGYAKLSGLAAAYAPPTVRFPGEFGTVNDVWGTPMVPCYYGPLWVLLSRAVAGGAATLGGAIVAFRVLELAAFAALVALIAWWRRDAVPVVLLALNPAVYVLYVAFAHNDLIAVAALLGGVVTARRFPWIAVLAVAAAALIKIPFAIYVLYVFGGRERVWRRIAYAAAALALTVVLSLALGGTAYVHDLTFRVHETTAVAGINYLTARVIKIGLVAVALIALLAAFARGVVWRSAGWSFIALGSLTYPWYLGWAIPYQSLERGALVAFLVLLPFVVPVMEPAFPHVGLGQLAMLAMLIAAAYEMLRLRPRPIEP